MALPPLQAASNLALQASGARESLPQFILVALPPIWVNFWRICRFSHIPTDLVVAQEASDVESSSRLDFLLLHNLGRHFIA